MVTTASRLLNMACTIRYRSDGPPDANNDPTDVWTDVETLCLIQQRARSESSDTSQVSSEVWGVYLSPDEIVPVSSDVLVVGDQTYPFIGNCWLAFDLAGRPDHIEGFAARGEP